MALRVWLPLNGNLENKGISDFTITNNTGAAINNNGKIGKCYFFDSIDDWLQGEFNKNFYSGKPITVACWFKCDKNDSGGFIVDLAADLCLGYLYDTNGIRFRTWRCYQNSSGTRTGSANVTTSYYDANSWHHIAAIFNEGIEVIYVDGVLSQEFNHTNLYTNFWTPLLGSTYNKISIGKSAGDSNWIGGYVNDVRIYDHCLSPLEVKEIAQGLILHYKLDGFSGGVGDNILTGTATQSTLMAFGTATTTRATGKWGSASGGNGVHAIIDISDDTPVSGVNWGFQITNNTSGNRDFAQGDQPYKNGVTYTVSWYMRGTGKYLIRQWNTTDGKQMQSKTASIDTTDWTYYTWTFTATEELETDVCTLHLGATGSTSLLQWCAMKMEIGSVATPWSPAPQDLGIDSSVIKDSSGYENNGILVNGSTQTTDSPRYQVYTNLLGTTVDNSSNTITGAQYWYAPFTLPAIETMTISWWGNNIAYGRGGIFETTSGNSGMVYERSDYNTTAIANWDSTFGIYNGSTRVNIFNNFIKDSNWHYHTITFDGANVKYYCDAILKQTSVLTGTLPAITGIKMGLGRAGSVYRQIKQKVSDFRWYATALSAEDIATLYHTPAQIDNLGGIHGFKFEEAGEKDSIYKNGVISTGQTKNYLVNNFTKSGNTTGWTFGGTSPTLSNGVMTLTGTAPQILSPIFTVNPDDIIVIKGTISLPTPGEGTSGKGLYLGSTNGQKTYCYSYNFTTNAWNNTTTTNTNPYWVNAYNETAEYTFKSYVVGSNVDINDIPIPEASTTRILYAIKLQENTSTRIRSGYNQNTSMVIQLSNFEVYNLKENGIIQEENNAKTGLGYIKYSNIIEK